MPTLEVAIITNLAVLLGGLVQGSVGFAGNLVATPLILLVAPSFVPVATLVNSALRASMLVFRERRAVDWKATFRLVLAQIPGLAAGALVVAVAPRRWLDAALAVIVLAAVGVSVVRSHRYVSRRAEIGIALASGVMTTTGSIGGPLLAMLYQDREGPVVRGTLSAVFAVSSVLGLAALAATGTVHRVGLVDAAIIVPGAVVGTLISTALAAVLDRRSIRPYILTLSALSGLAALAKVLVG
ncbi:MAG: sulfite exporter TauE/SafE family protein [Mycobacteriales bacterium]